MTPPSVASAEGVSGRADGVGGRDRGEEVGDGGVGEGAMVPVVGADVHRGGHVAASTRF